jgi:hypothetical protein
VLSTPKQTPSSGGHASSAVSPMTLYQHAFIV